MEYGTETHESGFPFPGWEKTIYFFPKLQLSDDDFRVAYFAIDLLFAVMSISLSALACEALIRHRVRKRQESAP